MSLALEHYRAIREGSQYPAAMPADDAARALNAMLTETQQLTLSQLPSSAARQLGSILFSHEAGLISAFGTLNPPRIKQRTSSGAFSLNLLFLILSLLAAVGAFYLVWQAGEFVWSLFIAFSAILACAAYFAPRKKLPPTVEQTVDTEALFSLAERRMEAIDRDLDAFLSIPGESGASDDSIVRIITLANSLRRADPQSVPDELMTAITALSISKGYEFLDYSPENEAFFDTMPTKRATRTIVPAVIRDKTLVARGMAIVSMGYTGEEETCDM
jgi:hypothetical protein